MGEISAYPWAAADFTRGQRANCSLVMQQQTLGSQFPRIRTDRLPVCISETEKYAHVTFFFNGGREEAFEREERKLVPSPKVATYDLKPEMSSDRKESETRSVQFAWTDSFPRIFLSLSLSLSLCQIFIFSCLFSVCRWSR